MSTTIDTSFKPSNDNTGVNAPVGGTSSTKPPGTVNTNSPLPPLPGAGVEKAPIPAISDAVVVVEEGLTPQEEAAQANNKRQQEIIQIEQEKVNAANKNVERQTATEAWYYADPQCCAILMGMTGFCDAISATSPSSKQANILEAELRKFLDGVKDLPNDELD